MSTTQQFSNEHMSVEYVSQPGCIVSMRVRVFEPEVIAAKAKVIKDIRKEVSLPGFRKGHVPANIIETRFSKEIEKEFLRTLTSLAFAEATALIQRPSFVKEEIALRSFSYVAGKEWTFSMEYEAEPIVPKIDISQLSIDPVEPLIATQEEIALRCLQFRYSSSTKEEVQRPVQLGDHIKASFVLDGVTHTEAWFLAKGVCPDWVLAAEGMVVGQTKELPFPTEETIKEVPLTISTISACTLPEETDLLKEKMTARLEYENKVSAQERMRKKVRNELIRTYAFDLPSSLVQSEADGRFAALQKTIETEQLDGEKIKTECLNEAKRFLTRSFLLHPLIASVPTSVNQMECLEELLHQSTSVPYPQRYVFPGLSEKTVISRISGSIMYQRCEDMLIEQKLHIAPPLFPAILSDQT